MNRRRFLNLIAGAGTAAALPPSMVWPFRKIFLPPQNTLIADRIFEELNAALRDFMHKTDQQFYVDGVAGITYYTTSPPPSYHDFFGLKRTPYPGRLSHTVKHIDQRNKVITFEVGRA